MKRFVPLLAAVAATGCGLSMPELLVPSVDIDVREVGRSLYCNTPGDAPRAQLLPDVKAVLDWQAARNVTLAGPESLAQAPYALVEMGMRPTGGYGLAVARRAVLRGERVVLDATFVSPAPGSLRTQAVSMPCVLVQLPPGRYRAVDVQDQNGAVRASGGLAEAPAPATEAPPADTPPAQAPPSAPDAPPAADTPGAG